MQSPYGSFFTQCAAFQVFNHSFQISTPHFSPCRLSQGGGGGGKGARCESAAQIRPKCRFVKKLVANSSKKRLYLNRQNRDWVS
jgi:hypothetical protein